MLSLQGVTATGSARPSYRDPSPWLLLCEPRTAVSLSSDRVPAQSGPTRYRRSRGWTEVSQLDLPNSLFRSAGQEDGFAGPYARADVGHPRLPHDLLLVRAIIPQVRVDCQNGRPLSQNG